MAGSDVLCVIFLFWTTTMKDPELNPVSLLTLCKLSRRSWCSYCYSWNKFQMKLFFSPFVCHVLLLYLVSLYIFHTLHLYSVSDVTGLQLKPANFLTQLLCQAISTQRTPKAEGTQVIVGSMNMGYILFIRHCQESNSLPVPFQVGADPIRPQWRTFQLMRR